MNRLSDKTRLWLRVIAFAVALVVGIGGITIGVVRLGSKKPGYYACETNPDEQAPTYALGVSLQYYLDGNSDAIKETSNRLRDAYSAALSRAYKLLDARNNYDGFVNLATLNAAYGTEIQVSDELFAVLTDAWDRTQAGEGFNLFAGALYEEWNSILILDEPEPFDPLNDDEVRIRIAELAKRTAELSNFSLTVLDAASHRIRVDVSEDYLAFLRENEYGTTVLDLNLLEVAYRLRIVRDALEADGLCHGYLTTSDGLTVSLSGNAVGEYAAYGLIDGKLAQIAALPVTASSACSIFCAAFTDIPYYYRITTGGVTHYRHPYFDAAGEFPELLEMAAVVAGDPVDARCAVIRMNNAQTTAELQAAANGAAYRLQGQPDTLYSGVEALRVIADGVHTAPIG